MTIDYAVVDETWSKYGLLKVVRSGNGYEWQVYGGVGQDNPLFKGYAGQFFDARQKAEVVLYKDLKEIFTILAAMSQKERDEQEPGDSELIEEVIRNVNGGRKAAALSKLKEIIEREKAEREPEDVRQLETAYALLAAEPMAKELEKGPVGDANRFGNLGVYQCSNCGKKTRRTGGDEESVQLCRECYADALTENSESDGYVERGDGAQAFLNNGGRVSDASYRKWKEWDAKKSVEKADRRCQSCGLEASECRKARNQGGPCCAECNHRPKKTVEKDAQLVAESVESGPSRGECQSCGHDYYRHVRGKCKEEGCNCSGWVRSKSMEKSGEWVVRDSGDGRFELYHTGTGARLPKPYKSRKEAESAANVANRQSGAYVKDTRYEPCPTCNTGHLGLKGGKPRDLKCPDCGGTGMKVSEKK